mgnify:CR=1 FL=1
MITGKFPPTSFNAKSIPLSSLTMAFFGVGNPLASSILFVVFLFSQFSMVSNVFIQKKLNLSKSSRTFCVYEDIENFKKMNLAKGGSLENALVVKDNKVLNKGGLRNSKEFVNHKILDCIGDLSLSGYKIIGKVRCSQGGHKLTNQLLREVFQNKDNFTIIEIKEKNIPHSLINRKYLRSIA